MLATRWQPLNVWSEMGKLQEEVGRIFDSGTGRARGFGAAFPALNVWEDEDRWYVEAELPGMGLDDIEILVHEDQLTIQGERKPLEIAEAKWSRCERGFGKFSRTLQFSNDVDADRVEAHLKQGVLLIELPKREEVKPRRIAVRSE